MGYIVRMPQMGMSMEEGTVVEWRVDEDGAVSEGETVAVVESEKTSADVEAREDGVLRRVLVAAGGVVEPGAPVGVIAGADEPLDGYLDELDGHAGEGEADAEAEAEAEAETETEGGDAADDAVREAGSGPSPRATSETAVPVTNRTDADDAAGERDGSAGERTDAVRASPGARRFAADRDVDVGTVSGTGPEGVVTEADVRRAVEAADDEGAAGPGGGVLERSSGAAGGGSEAVTGEAGDAATATGRAREAATQTVAEERELDRIQQITADRLGRSAREAPHVTLDRRVETAAAEAVLDAADTLGVDVSFTDLVVAAVADALVEHPAVNALFEDGVHALIEEVNVAVAVDADGDLLTPVIPHADALSVPELNRVRRDLTDRVLGGERSMDDLAGATFTVSNLGPYGVDRFSPIIDPPQVAILGVGRLRDGGVTLSLSFDHRVLNGAGAARFLDDVAGGLTDADALATRFELTG